MADIFRIYKGKEKALEGSSPLTITGLTASTDVKKGTYQAIRVRDGKEPAKVDTPAFRTAV